MSWITTSLELAHQLDQWSSAWLNQFAMRWPAMDALILRLASSDLTKGGVVLSVVWWAWFRPGSPERVRVVRGRLLATLVGTVVTLALARLLQLSLPLRLRPLHDPSMDWTLTYGLETRILDGWSSMPSDHAALFIALTVGFFTISRRLGGVVLAYCVFLILIPRAYVGLHYPGDLVLGALLGACCVMAVQAVWARSRHTERIWTWETQHPSWFYAVLFLFTTQLATLFAGARTIAGYLKDVASFLSA